MEALKTLESLEIGGKEASSVSESCDDVFLTFSNSVPDMKTRYGKEENLNKTFHYIFKF